MANHMIEQLVVAHQSLRDETEKALDFTPLRESGWLVMKTCLRQIAFSFQRSADSFAAPAEGSSKAEIYFGEDAYHFVLEVICGLHSPIKGETEVMGQFKDFIKKNEAPGFKRLYQEWLSDAKVIREKYMRDLGSRTYGSIIRRHLKDCQSPISILGAGHLTLEILPWLECASIDVRVYCRREAQGLELKEKYKKISVHAFDEDKLSGPAGAVVVSAPVKGEIIERWIQKNSSAVTQVIDLRGDSSTDRFNPGVELSTLTLHDLFNEMQSAEKEIELKVLQARRKIGELTRQRSQAIEIRPYGWEDLCG